MPTSIIIAVLSIQRVLSNAIVSGRTIRRPITHAQSHPIAEQRQGERRERGFKASLTARAMGWGTRARETISELNGNAFKHKQMKHLRSQILAGMDAKVGVLPLRILTENVCQACVSGGGQSLPGNRFLSPAELEIPHPTLAWGTRISSRPCLRCPEPGRSIQV